MIEIDLQLQNGKLSPFSQEATELLRNFKPNQVLRGKISGVKKEHSVPQLRMFFACCRTVAENTEDPEWDHKDKVCEQIKHALKFFDMTIVLPDGSVAFKTASISFANLSQCLRNDIFDRAWPIMADHIGCTVPELLENAQNEI